MMHLYSAGHARPLAARLADVLAHSPADPMAPEWMAVPSDGMRRWLTLELATHLGASGAGTGDGISANIARAYPGTLRNCVLAARRSPDEPDPWSIEKLVWSVLSVADEGSDVAALSPFIDLAPGASRYSSARRIADLFDRYHLHRPDMIRSWAAGDHVDGAARPIIHHAAWQPRLWQLVREHIGERSPPERLPALLGGLRRGEVELDLPERLVLFGFTLLPGGGFLELAGAVAHHRQVHLFMLEPTHLDSHRLHQLSPAPARGTPRLRSSDTTAELVRQPLLRSWGRLHRETALLLADGESHGIPRPVPVGDAPVDASTVLGRLQHDIRVNAPPSPTLTFDPADHSLQFHACYGPTRQVEVLRDALLHLLASEPSLTEDDIVVLCPALDRFAPLIEAVFGPSADASSPAGAVHRSADALAGAPSLRYRIADQSIRSSNPVVRATTELLELVTGRFEVAAVLDFLSLGPVRERFRFDDEDLAAMGDWVRATNVRWGVDPGQRAAFGVPDSVVANTWRAALDRLMLGSAIHDGDFTLGIGNVAPFGIEGTDIETAGRLAQAVWHLGDLAAQSLVARPIDEWIEKLRQVSGALFAITAGTEWQIEALHGLFADAIEAATDGGRTSPIPLTFTDMRRLLDERLEAKLGRPDFFRGGITVTSMTPLRWVPYRVVCIVGMDQWAFSPAPASGDDLAAGAPRIGDRDPRGEARQSLLEAVLAAGEHLLVLRDGRDVRTNQEIPRAVVVAELFDAAIAVVEPSHRDRLAQHLEINHPRQPFDDRCFEVGALADGVSWGFVGTDFKGAEARRRRVTGTAPFLRSPLDRVDAEVIELADLHAFFRNPAKAFLAQRLEARLPDSEEEVSGLLPMALRGLDGWRVGDRLLRARLAGVPVRAWRVFERRLGTLPPGSLEQNALSEVEAIVDELVATAAGKGVRRHPDDPFDIEVELADGTRIVGSVPLQLQAETPGPARVFYSRYKPHHRVAAWLDLMALVGTDPSRPWRSLAIGKSAEARSKAPQVADLVPTAAAEGRRTAAHTSLAVAVDCYRRGMTEPLPLFPSFSRQVHEGTEARKHWCTFGGLGDGDDAAVKLAFGAPDFDEIMALPVEPGDPSGGSGRVARFAHYLWEEIEVSTKDYVPAADGSPDLPRP